MRLPIMKYFLNYMILTLAIIAGGEKLIIGCHCRLLEKPSHQTVLAGHSVRFKCTSDMVDNPMIWYWSQARQPSVKEVFNGVNGKDPRFRFEHEANGNTSRTCWLIMDSVMVEDGGSVACQEDEGFGERSLAKLSVIRGKPNCTFNSSDEQLIMECTYHYWGESALEPNWMLRLKHTKVSEDERNDTDWRVGNLCSHKSTLKINTTCSFCPMMKIIMKVEDRSAGSPAVIFHIKDANSSDGCGNCQNDDTVLITTISSTNPYISSVTVAQEGHCNQVTLSLRIAVSVAALMSVFVIVTCIYYCTLRLTYKCRGSRNHGDWEHTVHSFRPKYLSRPVHDKHPESVSQMLSLLSPVSSDSSAITAYELAQLISQSSENICQVSDNHPFSDSGSGYMNATQADTKMTSVAEAERIIDLLSKNGWRVIRPAGCQRPKSVDSFM